MTLRCPHCGAMLHSKDVELTDAAPSTCWMCTLPIPAEESSRQISPPTIARQHSKSRNRSGAIRAAIDAPSKTLCLPDDRQIKIYVLGGPSRGKEFDLSRPLMTIGRLHGGADIEINDPEVSRSHCAVELRRDMILLHDLKSTNGIYIGDSRVFAAQLDATSTFRIGHSILQIRSIASKKLD